MEDWPKETWEQVRDRVLRSLVETKLHEASPEERAALVPSIRDFQQRQQQQESLSKRQNAAFRQLQMRIAIIAVIATLVVGAASVAASFLARSNAPVIIQPAPPSFTPFPVAPSATPRG